MLVRKISKTALLVGAGLIILLLISLLYISSKIKREFEQKIHAYLATLVMEGYDLAYEPFECKGLLSYECSSKAFKVLNASDSSLILSMKNLKIGLKDIKTYSMQEYAQAEIDNINYDMPEDFKPVAIKYFNTDQVQDRRDGVVKNNGWIEVETKSASFILKLDMNRKNPIFANKNMIKIVLQIPIDVFLENTLFDIQELSFVVKSKHLYQSLLKISNMKEGEYQKYIEHEIKDAQTLISLYQEAFNLPYRQEFSKVFQAYAWLLNGQKDVVELGLKVREQGPHYLNLNYVKSAEGLKKVFNQISDHYDVYVTAE